MHILIIEDDLLVALDVEDSLSALGSITTALAATEENAVKSAVNRRPDLIISDVRLADGSGPAAIQRIRETVGEIPVMYVTGNPERAREDDPGAPVLPKPFDRTALVGWCRETVLSGVSAT